MSDTNATDPNGTNPNGTNPQQTESAESARDLPPAAVTPPTAAAEAAPTPAVPPIPAEEVPPPPAAVTPPVPGYAPTFEPMPPPLPPTGLPPITQYPTPSVAQSSTPAVTPPPIPFSSPSPAAASPQSTDSTGPNTQPPSDAGASFGLAAAPNVQWAPAAQKPSSGRGAHVASILLAAAMVGGIAGIGGSWAWNEWIGSQQSNTVAGPAAVTVNNDDKVNLHTAIATKVLPSVVTIAAADTAGSGTGSGVILSADGYVVTNTHVVTLDGATANAQIRVTTSDGRVFDAKVVGTDPLYDLAVIKLVDASGLTPIEFADSSALNVGDETVVVGAPLGLSNTVTTGIVSALNRSIQIASSAAPDIGGDTEEEVTPEGEPAPFQFDFGTGDTQPRANQSISINVIQTDAAINPGNSGGALVGADGTLIGINVAIASAGGSSKQAGSIGVGFSIPSNIVERIANELIETGVATHGLLGATVSSAAHQEGATIAGALISNVSPGGAAQAAGLRSGDIVTAFNDSPVTNASDLTAQVRAVAAGSEAKVTYVRNGKTDTVTVTLGALTE